jgi:hypothetical protein
MGAEYFFGFFSSFMFICKSIYHAVQGDALLDNNRVIEFPFALYKITDKISHQYFGVVKRKICVR